MVKICLHPVDLIAVSFHEKQTTDNVKLLLPKARCTQCDSGLPQLEPNARRAIDIAMMGSGMKRSGSTKKGNSRK